MKVYLMPEFINDLKSSADSKLIRQALRHTLNNDGTFIADADDHRYRGIKEAWIRVISKGFRVIYLIEGDSVYLYRAGQHSVEDRLAPPSDLDGIPLGIAAPILLPPDHETAEPINLGCLLKTTEATFLNKEIISLYHVGHHEIILISPFIEAELLHRRHHFGSFLDRAVEDNTEVTLVTKPPKTKELGIYKDLEERAIFVYFLPGLHSKLYIFNVDSAKRSEYTKTIQSKVIVGSSNLTRPGFGLDDDLTNYEVCYCLPIMKFPEAYQYAKKLINKAMDFRYFELKLRR